MRPAKDPLRKEPPGVGGAPAKGTLLTGAEPAATGGGERHRLCPEVLPLGGGAVSEPATAQPG